MQYTITAATLLLTLGLANAAAETEPPTDQTKRGQKLFLTSTKGAACATCHEMANSGTAVGPSLVNIASFAMPRGIAMAIRMSTTETVQSVTLQDSSKFPARIVEKKDGAYRLWKLSTTPPVLETISEKDVKSLERDQSWKHPPASADYTAAEMADLVGFLRWAANGNVKTVTEEEVGSSQ